MNTTHYCAHCDMFLKLEEGEVWYPADDVDKIDARCTYCNRDVQTEPDPNEGPYDTLEEKAL